MNQVASLPRFELPEDEGYRLHVLSSLELLDTPPEAEFDAVVKLAQHVLDCPMALVSLVDADRQWFKARCGLGATETPREYAFCHHALREPDMLVINDATRDPRFASNPLVTGAPHVRFYAGVPIRVALSPDQKAAGLGTLCVIDTKPRILSVTQMEMLRHLARLTETIITSRFHVANAVHYGEERRADSVRIARQHRQLAQAERMAAIGSWRLQLDNDKLEWSDEVFAIHGLPVGDTPPIDLAFGFYPEHARPVVQNAVEQTIATGQPLDIETDFISSNGAHKRIHTIGELELVDGVPVAPIGVFQDVTERYGMEQALRRSAEQDWLTGIANRAGFNATLDLAMTEASAEGRTLALALIDLDGFKQVNDVHGHRGGDELLKEIAFRLQTPPLANCFAARLGGDEFALIIPEPRDCMDVQAIAAHVLAELQRPVMISEGEVRVSGTIGLSWMEAGVARPELMHRADIALYAGKRAGKGVVRCWNRETMEAVICADRRTGSRGRR